MLYSIVVLHSRVLMHEDLSSPTEADHQRSGRAASHIGRTDYCHCGYRDQTRTAVSTPLLPFLPHEVSNSFAL